jgi:hypothetical protein
LGADYEELCSCYARLLLSQDEADGEPEYCRHVQTRQAWTELLPSLGAKQIGGELGEQAASLAWLGRDSGAVDGLTVLAFTVPLTPLRATGITHGQLPLLLKDLLTWQGLLQTAGNAAGVNAAWPRFDDLGAL